MEKQEKEETPILHGINSEEVVMKPMFSRNIIIILIVVALLGVGTGYLLAGTSKGTSGYTVKSNIPGTVSKGMSEGSDDIKTFKDIAEGKLEEGGIEGEGQFHLTRPGGISQTVYMTSSIVDLSKYVGKKVKVWGQTQTARTAGWLMDVGKVEVLE